MLTRRSGVTFAVSTDEDTWARLSGRGGRVHLAIPELIPELEGLADEPSFGPTAEFPFILSSGERRSGSANTIFRDPAWRKKDQAGALRISPQDAATVGVADGGEVRLTTRTAAVTTVVEISEMMQPGHVSLPNGFGLRYPDSDGKLTTWGIPPNDLTGTDDRDWFAGTPWHKHIPARVELAS
jgi:anaerobic selenocysteine-containing dehydrogenase